MNSLLRIYASGDYGKLQEISLVKKEKYLREFFSDCYHWYFEEPITAIRLNIDFKLYLENDVVPDYAMRYIFNVAI